MNPSPIVFGELLTKAVRQIKAIEDKNLDVIQDELGHALGREGASFIQFLRKGHVPSELADTERLAQQLYQRKGLDAAETMRFLKVAGHPNPDHLIGGEQTPPHAQPANGQVQQVAELTLDELFVAGPPILKPRQFFGRNQELTQIFGWLARSPLHHISLVGPRRSGKTSLLHYLRKVTLSPPALLRPHQKQDWLPSPERYEWIHVDFQDPRLRKQASLLRYLLNSLELPIPEPCTLDHFMDVFSAHHWQQPTVILVDELEAGLQAPELDQEFWEAMRSLLSTTAEGNLAFVLTSHVPPETLADEAQKSSSFFNIFINLELGPFTEVEARQFIAASPVAFAAEDVAWILEQSARWPCLLGHLCQERLAALRLADQSTRWRHAALRRIAPYRHLLQETNAR